MMDVYLPSLPSDLHVTLMKSAQYIPIRPMTAYYSMDISHGIIGKSCQTLPQHPMPKTTM